jgi:hypothetical protein
MAVGPAAASLEQARRKRRRPSTMTRRFFTPSMAVACLALAVALSGTAYAVTRLPVNSVGTNQVINHSLRGVDLRRGTLLRGTAGPRGLQGPQGAPGPRGATGPQGAPGKINTVFPRSKSAAISPTAGVRTTVSTVCANGTRTLYGGFTADVPVYVLSSYSSNELNWIVTVQSTGVAGTVWVYSTCFSG